MTPTATATATAVATQVLPPDPSSVAPPIDPSLATDLATASQFLYTGPSPIQTGVAPAAIDPARVAVLRGRVITRDGQPLPGVSITVHAHPDFGQTLSRADGMFDLATNGGGPVALDYTRPGYLPAQREIDTAWQDFANPPDVALIPLDPQVSRIDLSSSQPIQVARGSQVTDADGTRQATLLFPNGTGATLVMPDGSTQPVSALNIHATEYTVGPNGSDAMPGDLPSTSAYTYAVNFSVDEAMSAGATEIRFSSPVPLYVENFLNFPVGTFVPLGTYDRTKAAWVAGDSGRVIKILSITNGRADLDTDGDNRPDSAATLAALAITDAERQQLALTYSPGQTLWRVLMPHFSDADLNWGIGPPPGSRGPNGRPRREKPLPGTCRSSNNSSSECQNQILHEDIGIIGAPFNLVYQSERTPGRTAAYTVEIPLSDAPLPPGVRSMELEVRVAGQFFKQSFAPQTNLTTTFTWNGRDAYGRTLNGTQPITIRTGYTYGAVYGGPVRFGDPGTGRITGVVARREITLWQTWQDVIGTWDARSAGLGGWTLSAHHAYDPAEHVLYRGDGTREPAGGFTASSSTAINTYAGTGTISGRIVEGAQATTQPVDPQGLGVAADGSLYIANGLLLTVRRVARDGTIRTVAGAGFHCSTPTDPCGDGGPALQAGLDGASALAVGPDGSVYVGGATGRIRKIDPNGIITTVAGTGTNGFGGDGGPATQALLNQTPEGLAVGPDNTLYIADTFNKRVRRVGPDGIITTFAGDGTSCAPSTAACGDGGPANQAQMAFPQGVAIASDGSVLVSDSVGRVRLVTPDGIIHTAAGTGDAGFSGDAGLATQATFRNTTAVAVGADDTIYVVDQGNNRVRWFRIGGPIFTLAGTGISGTSGDGGLALDADLQGIDFGLAVGPDRGVYVSQTHNNVRVRKIAALTDQFSGGAIVVPSNDGREVYLFTPNGRHLSTLDALTGITRYQFGYSAAGRLMSITDADGNVTSVQRDNSGNPTGIVGPFGQRTAISVNGAGYLTQVVSPAGETVQMSQTPDGLLTGVTRPKGQLSQYAYDGMGRLIRTVDPSGATKTLSRSGTNDDYTVTLTTAVGTSTTYRVQRLQSGDVQLTTIGPAGGQGQALIQANGKQHATLADGTTVDVVLGADPRFGMRAPFDASVTQTTPGGKTQTVARQRSVTLANPADQFSLTSQTDTASVNGRNSTVTFDAATRTVSATTAAGRHATLLLDNHDRPSQQQVGDLAAVTYTYDGRGRLSSLNHSGRVSQFTYGMDGFVVSITNSLDQTITLVNDADGRVTQETLPDGRVVHAAYDSDGNTTSLITPDGAQHALTYSTRDELSGYTPPAVGTENDQVNYAYDANRRPLSVTRADGQVVGFHYDSASRIDLLHLASGDLSFGYSASGQITSVSAPGVAIAYSYDGNLPTGASWSGAVAGTLARTFDADFRISSENVNGGSTVAIQYDADSLPIQIGGLSLARSGQTGLITSTSLGSLTDAFGYDTFGDPVHYSASIGGNSVFGLDVTRDSVARVASRSETLAGVNHTFAYVYDASGRITEVRQDNVLSESYAYDGNGNRTQASGAAGTILAAYDAQDRLVQYGATSFAYTPNGERQSASSSGQTTLYRYDSLGNLTGVTLANGTQVDYLLDGIHRRAGKRVNGTLTQAFLYRDGLHPVAELDAAGNLVSRFVYAGGNTPVYMQKGGVSYRVISDHVGSPRLIVDATSGAIAQRLDYDTFGNVVLDTNPGFQPFGFGGGLYDSQTRLVHFGAREYDAHTGRWLTKDPMGFGGGDANLYAYVGDDPVNRADPSGLSTIPGFPDSVKVGLAGMCAANPPECEELAEEIGSGVNLAQHAAQAAPAANDVAQMVCNPDTIQGVVVGARTLVDNVGTVSTLQGLGPQLANAVQEVSEWPVIDPSDDRGVALPPVAATRGNVEQQDMGAHGELDYRGHRAVYGRV